MRLAQMENINLTQKDFDDYIELVDQMNQMDAINEARRTAEKKIRGRTVCRNCDKLADKHKIDGRLTRKFMRLS